MAAKKSKKAAASSQEPEPEDVMEDVQDVQNAQDTVENSMSGSEEENDGMSEGELSPEEGDEDEENEENDEDADGTDGAENEEEGGKRSKRTSRGIKKSNMRARAFRKLARAAGYIQTSSRAASGKDSLLPLLSRHDVQRMMKYLPTGGVHSFSAKELAIREGLTGEKISPNALQEAQARLDSRMRSIMNKCALYIARNGSLRVNASVVGAVLASLPTDTELTSVAAPPGLIKAAMDQKVLHKDDRFANVKDTKKPSGARDAERKAARAANKAQVKAAAVEARAKA